MSLRRIRRGASRDFSKLRIESARVVRIDFSVAQPLLPADEKSEAVVEYRPAAWHAGKQVTCDRPGMFN